MDPVAGDAAGVAAIDRRAEAGACGHEQCDQDDLEDGRAI